jgi:hypothetical protein
VLPHNAAGLDDERHDVAAQAWARMGSRRLLGPQRDRRVRSQAARRSSSGLSSSSESTESIECGCMGIVTLSQTSTSRVERCTRAYETLLRAGTEPPRTARHRDTAEKQARRRSETGEPRGTRGLPPSHRRGSRAGAPNGSRASARARRKR